MSARTRLDDSMQRALVGLLFFALVMTSQHPGRAETLETVTPNGQSRPEEGAGREETPRSVGSDFRTALWRIPSVYGGQFFTWEGLRVFLYSSPFLGASFIEERAVSDWCMENRIGEGTVADSTLDFIGGTLYPLLWVPLYGLARGVGNDRLADLSVDLATFTIAIFPEITVLRYIGDRPQPNGGKDFAFGTKACSSFPSGHTAAAVGVARLADHAYGHAVGVPLYLLAAAIAYQRLGEGEHYLADVVGGAILGFSVADSIVRQRRREQEEGHLRNELSVLPMVGGRYRAVGVALSWGF